MSIGIERAHVYVPPWVLPVRDLALARGVDADAVAAEVGTVELAVAPPCEDVVTMAATAGARVLRAARVDPREIGLVVLGTGKGVDQQKPAAVFVHRLLGIGASCRVFDVKHAGYGGTAGLMVAADWIRAARGRARRALVLASDMPRAPLGTLGEYAQGAAATALLVGTEPRALLLGDESGRWARAVDDSWRPPGAQHTSGDTDVMREACLDAVGGAFADFRPLEHPEPVGDEVVTDRLAHLLLQLPFPALARAAHRRLVEADWRANERRWAQEQPRLDEALAAAFAEQVEPTLEVTRRVGAAGAAGLWLAFAALLESQGRRLGVRRLGLFAWGSGGAAEFFTGMVPATVGQVADAGVGAGLAGRRPIDVATWEAARAAGAADTGGEPPEGFPGEFVFRGAPGGKRCYEQVA